MSRRVLGAALALAAALTSPVAAQDAGARQYPAGPIAPTDRRECDALERQWSNLVSQYSERHQACLDANKGKEIPGAGACSKAPCLHLHGFPEPDVARYRNAQIKQCRDAVAEHERRLTAEKAQRDEAARRAAQEAQRAQEQARSDAARREADRRKAEEDRRAADARREQARQDARSAAERERQAALDRQREAAERERAARAEQERVRNEREAARQREREHQKQIAVQDIRMQDHLQQLVAANTEGAAQARNQVHVETSRLERQADDVAVHNETVLDRISSVVDQVKVAGNLFAGNVEAMSAPGFDLGGAAPAPDRGAALINHTLDGADLALSFASPISSLPFALFRNVVDAQIELQNNLFRSLDALERGDTRFLERDFVTEFGERAFGPRAFLGTVGKHVAVGAAEQYIKGQFQPVYRPVYRSQPPAAADHFWSAQRAPGARPIRDDRGAIVLFDRAGRRVHVDMTSPAELEHLVATTDARPRYRGDSRWEEKTLIWSPTLDDEDPWWVDSPLDPGWWVVRALDNELDRALDRSGREGRAQ